MSFDLEQLHKDFSKLNYYSKFGQSASDRVKNTDGRDEYTLIIRSLLILDVLENKELDNAAAAAEIAKGFPGSEFGFSPLAPVANIVPNVAYLRDLLKELNSQEIKEGYVLHDVTKAKAFVIDNSLDEESQFDVRKHDNYLDAYLAKNSKLKALFDNQKLSVFIKILDLLGHSPAKLVAPAPFASLKMVAKTAVEVKEYAEEITVKQVEPMLATRKEIKKLLENKANSLSLPSAFINDIKPIDSNKKFTSLTGSQKDKLAFLMWTGGLRIEASGEQLDAFKKAWNDPKNRWVVRKMTDLLMKNLEQEKGYCLPFNVTGLMHKTDAKVEGFKAFIGPADKGGMGATMEEVVTVAFPFILDKCKDPIHSKATVVGHNEFQIQQLVEMVYNLFLHLGGISTGKNTYPNRNFDTQRMHIELNNELDTSRMKLSVSRAFSAAPTLLTSDFFDKLRDKAHTELAKETESQNNLSI